MITNFSCIRFFCSEQFRRKVGLKMSFTMQNLFLNFMHIPDKPGQSHKIQEFEESLAEVKHVL